ncbi:hypothetical protein R5W23_003037 [Gemmata sp. JC673]|uniref:Uncharacterized protein n=1 Tax=Gemmata algarum TaxID=2975278 RepID=A0ABU5ET10_9BACT|nr:hypothetical protein [Gemmata algarum]MDY3557772.1 hypothetical protein [Gemmata algarum]
MPQRLSDVPMSELVPETQQWNGGHGIDLLTWFGCVGSIEHAIAYGELFWPDFVEYDGCVLFAGFNEASYRGFMSQTGDDRRAVEAVMNHRHIIDIFSGSGQEPTRHQVVYLGRLLREMWTAKLRQNFPTKTVVVSFPEEPSERLLDYEITFYQTEQ